MPVARFQMPDGRVARFEVPDGTTPEQAQALIAQEVDASAGQAPPSAQRSGHPAVLASQAEGRQQMAEGRSKLRSLAEGGLSGAAGIGNTLLAPTRWTLDALAPKETTLSSLVTGQTNRTGPLAPVADHLGRTRGAMADLKDQNKENPISFGAGKLAAEVALTAPVGGGIAAAGRTLAPRLAATAGGANLLRAVETGGLAGGGLLSRSVGGAITGAASTGLANPDDTLHGAAVGGALPGVLKIAGAAGRGAGSILRPAAQSEPLVRKAVQQYGIPLAPGDVTRNDMVRGARSFLNDLPVIGRSGRKLKDAQTEAFNREVGRTFGSPETSLTPQVMDRARDRLGSEFDRIWNNNVLEVDGALVQKLSDLQNAARKLPTNHGASLDAELQDLLSKVQTGQSGAPFIPGDVANKFQSHIRRRAEGSADLRNELTDLRQSIIGAFNRSVSPQDAAALTLNRARYKAFKTVEPLLNGAETGVAGRVAGDVPMALLPQAVNRSYSRAGNAPLADLSSIGSRFLVDRVPRTGGSARAMIQNSALGTGLTLGGYANLPLAAASVGGLTATNGLLNSPAVLRGLLAPSAAPGAAQRLLYRGAPLLTAE